MTYNPLNSMIENSTTVELLLDGVDQEYVLVNDALLEILRQISSADQNILAYAKQVEGDLERITRDVVGGYHTTSGLSSGSVRLTEAMTQRATLVQTANMLIATSA